jgi:hypothetical protein
VPATPHVEHHFTGSEDDDPAREIAEIKRLAERATQLRQDDAWAKACGHQKVTTSPGEIGS